MKDIKYYLTFYLGCECRVIKHDNHYVIGRLITVSEGGCVVLGNDNEKYYRTKLVQLGLRPLSDMTEEEKDKLMDIAFLEPEDLEILIGGTAHLTTIKDWADAVNYLLKQGFDLFGLIEAELAIDKTKTNHQ